MRPTPASTGPWRYDGVPISPRRSARAPSSSAGTPLSPGPSSTWSCPQNLLGPAVDSARPDSIKSEPFDRRHEQETDRTYGPLSLQLGSRLHVVEVQPAPVSNVSPAALFSVDIRCRTRTSRIVQEITDGLVSVRLKLKSINVTEIQPRAV